MRLNDSREIFFKETKNVFEQIVNVRTILTGLYSPV